MKHSALILCALSCLCLSTTVRAAQSDDEMNFRKTGENSVEASQSVQADADVISVNKKTREIKFKDSTGKTLSVIAGDEVKNFAQIKKGDHLRINYSESLALELKKNGGTPITANETSELKQAEPGQKPGGSMVDRITARGTVTKVDRKTQSVTVSGAHGDVVMHVKKKDVFNKIKKGDQIEATYTQAMAISIESVKK